MSLTLLIKHLCSSSPNNSLTRTVHPPQADEYHDELDVFSREGDRCNICETTIAESSSSMGGNSPCRCSLLWSCGTKTTLSRGIGGILGDKWGRFWGDGEGRVYAYTSMKYLEYEISRTVPSSSAHILLVITNFRVSA